MHINRVILAGFLAVGCMSAAYAQQGVSLGSGLTDFTQWTLLGDATAQNDTPGNGFTYSNLVLTASGIEGQAGAGFAPVALTMDFDQAFSFDFHFFIPANGGLRGDGLTFVMADAGLGYEGAPTGSVAFAIDTFNFTGEPESPSLQILQGGSVVPLASTETHLGDSIRDPNFQWYATVNYTPSGLDDLRGTFVGRIEHPDLGSFEVSSLVDFAELANKPVYYGFTAGNGLATDGHYVTSAAPVPEPQTYAMMLAGMCLMGWVARRRKQAST
jgi:hypothetical protein